jgi:hypothetical protein
MTIQAGGGSRINVMPAAGQFPTEERHHTRVPLNATAALVDRYPGAVAAGVIERGAALLSRHGCVQDDPFQGLLLLGLLASGGTQKHLPRQARDTSRQDSQNRRKR